jgi:hypothetical protein
MKILGIIQSLLPRPIYRWKQELEVHGKNPAGEGQFALYTEKLVLFASKYLKEIFFDHDLKIEVNTEKYSISDNYFNTVNLPNDNEHQFGLEINIPFNNKIYTFSINNIPKQGRIFRNDIFFETFANYVELSLNQIAKNSIINKDSSRAPSNELMYTSDYFLLNIRRTLVIEFLFSCLNTKRKFTGKNNWTLVDKLFIDLELLQIAFDFSLELSSHKIENKEIKSGFILIGKPFIKDYSRNIIFFSLPIEFGEYSSIKNLIQAVDGETYAFVVHDYKILGIINLKKYSYSSSISDISIDDEDTPLLISIQGKGKLNFYQFNSKGKAHLLEIQNTKTRFHDKLYSYSAIGKKISEFSNSSINAEVVNNLLEYAISSKKGMTIIIGNFSSENLRLNLVTYTSFERVNLNNISETLLQNFINLDGAIILDSIGDILAIGAILIFKNAVKTSGGARHISAINFTNDHQCLGLTVSEDGSITIFENGIVFLKIV